MKAKTIYLHIGGPKTGSTSLQRTMLKSNEILKSYNINYPSSFHPHNLTFFPLFIKNPLSFPDWKKKEFTMKQAINYQNELKKQWEAEFHKDFDHVIISSEIISESWNSEMIQQSKKFLSRYFDHIKIVYYIRPHLSYFSSMVQQVVKNGFTNHTIQELLKQEINKTNYKSVIQKWTKVFGEHNLILRPFQKNYLKNSDVIDDFFDSIGFVDLTSEKLIVERTNESLGKKSIILLNELNQKYPVFENNKLNKKRGLANRYIPVSVFNSVPDEKFKLDVKLNKSETIKVNEDISFINNYLPDNQKFNHIDESNLVTEVPQKEEITIEYFVDLVNEYHKHIEMLMNRIDDLKNKLENNSNKNPNLHKVPESKTNTGLIQQKINQIQSNLNSLTMKMDATVSNKHLLLLLYKRHKARRFRNGIKYLMIRSLDSFDEQFYISENPDIVKFGIRPLKHFILYGAYEGRNPNPEFNTIDYICHNPELVLTGENPLVHFERKRKNVKVPI